MGIRAGECTTSRAQSKCTGGGGGMRSVLDVTNDQIFRMSPEDAVDLFQRLLWAEASRIGVGINNVNISRWIDVPDGGIDASVREVPAGRHSGLLRPGLTGYQIKTGQSFKPWQDSQIKKELFGKKKPARRNLGPSVQHCLEKHGTYVLVCSGNDLDDQKRRAAEAIIKRHFAESGYAEATAEVWSINQILGFLKPFPSLAISINDLDAHDFQSHETWSKNEDMRCIFQGGAAQRGFADHIREILRRVDVPVHIRVSGEPGIGKTKLLLEATSAGDLNAVVLYFESPEAVKARGFLSTIIQKDSPHHCTLVVDECVFDESARLWNKVKCHSPRIKLVTICCDDEVTSGSTEHLSIPALAEEEISSIIESYGIQRHRAHRWTEFCSGSPRVAHIVGQNLRNNPDDLMRSPDHVDVWKRFIAGTHDMADSEIRRRELVLRTLALFKRCGFEGPVRGESEIVGEIVKRIDPQVKFHQFRRVIQELRSRGIVKGSKTVHISPKLLHVKLWGDWWDSYGDDFGTLVGEISQFPADLRNWFYEMFEYAAGFDATRRIAKDLLAQDGIVATVQDLKNQDRAQFFTALVSADPEAALSCLQRTVGKCTKEELEEFIAGRRKVIGALEKIAVWRGLFSDAAKLLLRLAEAENETWSNNASGVFVSLFSPAPGVAAPTEVSPLERFPILVETIGSEASETRLLAIRACDEALESDHFSRLGTPHHQGLQQDAQLWMPMTWKELFDYYRQVWALLCTRQNCLPDDERKKATEVILNRSRGLIRFAALADMVAETLEEMASKRYVTTRELLPRIVDILDVVKTLRPECRARLEQLRDRLTGHDFSSLLHRYVGMTVVEDNYDYEGNPVNIGKERIADLARQAVSAPALLQRELGWLVSREAQNAYSFGYELAKSDPDVKTLPSIKEAYHVAEVCEDVDLLAGYLKWIFETNQPLWEEQLEYLCSDDRINRKLPEITVKSGASDQAALRILRLFRSGILGATDCAVFRYGPLIKHLSEAVFASVLDVLLTDPSVFSASTALDLIDFRYHRKNSEQELPEALTFRVLTHPGFLRKLKSARRDYMDEFRWKHVALKFVSLYPARSLELADQMIASFGQHDSIMKSYPPYPLSVLDEITRQFPLEMWEKLTAHLVIPFDRKSLAITSWLQGQHRDQDPGQKNETQTALEFIPVERIWIWIDQDVENRAWYFAYSMVPKNLFREEGRTCLAREMLARYGHMEPVRRNFGTNFDSGGWSGSSSLHWARKKQMLEDFKKVEDNQIVRQWIDEQIDWLDKLIEKARVEEERENW